MECSDPLQVRLSSSVELIRASLEPYIAWIEAIDLQVSGDHELKTASGAAPGFIRTHLLLLCYKLNTLN
jgi:hypothetical protein